MVSIFTAGNWEKDTIFGVAQKKKFDPSYFVRALKLSNVTDQNVLYYTSVPYLFYFHPKITSGVASFVRKMAPSLPLTAFSKYSWFVW